MPDRGESLRALPSEQSTDDVQSPPYAIFTGSSYEDANDVRLERGTTTGSWASAIQPTSQQRFREVSGVSLTRYLLTAAVTDPDIVTNAIVHVDGNLQTLVMQPFQSGYFASILEWGWLFPTTSDGSGISISSSGRRVGPGYMLKVQMGNADDGQAFQEFHCKPSSCGRPQSCAFPVVNKRTASTRGRRCSRVSQYQTRECRRASFDGSL